MHFSANVGVCFSFVGISPEKKKSVDPLNATKSRAHQNQRSMIRCASPRSVRFANLRSLGKRPTFEKINYLAFAVLDDEVITLIMEHIFQSDLTKHTRDQFRLRRDMRVAVTSLHAFVLSCKRIHEIFTKSQLRDEVLARASTSVVPRNVFSTKNPFSAQLVAEQHSSRLMNFFRSCVSQMVFHCAGKCCHQLRREIQRDTQKKFVALAQTKSGLSRAEFGFRTIVPAIDRSTLVAPSADGEVAFAATRRRVSSPTLNERDSPRRRARSEWLVRLKQRKFTPDGRASPKVTVEETHSIELGSADCKSGPEYLESSADGTQVAMIRSVFSLDDTEAHSVAEAWIPEENRLISIEPPLELEAAGAINAQKAWFSKDKLCVLFSTAYKHPVGSLMSDEIKFACYAIAIYEDFVIESFVGPYSGLVTSASARADGTEVAVLTTRQTSASVTNTDVRIHDISEEYEWRVDVCPGQGLAPSSIGFSPEGDSLVCIHVSSLHIYAEVLIRTRKKLMVSVHRNELSHWLFSKHGVISNLPHLITFSPCGRYLLVTDQRSAFGVEGPNNSIVLFDLSLGREKRRGVRTLPISSVEDATPRSIAWTANGMWIQARHGAVLVTSS